MSSAANDMRKRQRTDLPANGIPDAHALPPAPVGDDAFIQDNDAGESGADDDEDEDKPKSDKKAGRRKIKIEFIQDKSRRHITFSKRKAGIMKKAYELSTLTGTQVLLLVVSETGLVYTFTTAKLQPLVTQPEGKNLIQACLNAPHGTLPSSMPVGPPLGRSAGSAMNIPGPPPSANIPGGLSISGGPNIKEDEAEEDHGEDQAAAHGGRPSTGDKRRRRGSSTSGPVAAAAASAGRNVTSPHTHNATIPPPLSIPSGQQGQQPHPHHPQNQSQIALGSPTSPQQQHQTPTAPPPQYSPTYGHHPNQHPQQSHDPNMYNGAHMMPGGYTYPGPAGAPPPGAPPQQLGALSAAAANQQQHNQWTQQQQQYGARR
ncbi:hypothetical protein D9619_006944 [Psilocybe cf. subviscida]|uniref:MADS-box domain-containing protein n=1 Tax=Psilocybe cf. subviscida TaxID=2480587 RepID=A0A8H5B196_9AGAR|nr:hypothetical protein D9619_006944 [Psilocybe cf. subviscida]